MTQKELEGGNCRASELKNGSGNPGPAVNNAFANVMQNDGMNRTRMEREVGPLVRNWQQGDSSTVADGLILRGT